MGNPNIKGNERCTLVGVIDPDVSTAATYLTGAIDMAAYESCMAVVFAGTLGTSATVDAKLTQATTSGGTYKDVTGKAITQLTEAGTDSDKQAIINCRADELDVANGYRYVKLSVTVAVATSDMAAALFGLDARYQPGTDSTTVDEIV